MPEGRLILDKRTVTKAGTVVLPQVLKDEEEVVFEMNESKEIVVRPNRVGDAS